MVHTTVSGRPFSDRIWLHQDVRFRRVSGTNIRLRLFGAVYRADPNENWSDPEFQAATKVILRCPSNIYR